MIVFQKLATKNKELNWLKNTLWTSLECSSTFSFFAFSKICFFFMICQFFVHFFFNFMISDKIFLVRFGTLGNKRTFMKTITSISVCVGVLNEGLLDFLGIRRTVAYIFDTVHDSSVSYHSHQVRCFKKYFISKVLPRSMNGIIVLFQFESESGYGKIGVCLVHSVGQTHSGYCGTKHNYSWGVGPDQLLAKW